MAKKELSALFLESAVSRLAGIKALADRAIAQVDDRDLHWSPDPESNSIAVLMQHVSGNLVSRWVDFLTTDGEKLSRDRDSEFVAQPQASRAALLEAWERGWGVLNAALSGLAPSDLERDVVIRGQTLSVVDAIHRQIAHYGEHAGQIVYVAKHRKGASWKTLSIARGASKDFRPARKD